LVKGDEYDDTEGILEGWWPYFTDLFGNSDQGNFDTEKLELAKIQNVIIELFLLDLFLQDLCQLRSVQFLVELGLHV
jgi:hypothetical protein